MAEINWPKKLLAKLHIPPITLALVEPVDSSILNALSFIESLRFDTAGPAGRNVIQQFLHAHHF